MSTTHRVHAPGRVNLIGEHTDHSGGLVFPMAIDRGMTITYTAAESIDLTSDSATGNVHLDLPFTGEPATVEPHWGAYVAAVAREMRVERGLRGRIESDIPAGAGLSSSHALGCAIAIALGFDGSAAELALLTQRAEHRATGVPTGIMDQLSIASGRAGHAMLIDCHTLDVTPIPMPIDVDVVVEFIVARTLEGSGYSDRVTEVRLAEAEIGPLRMAGPADAERIVDPVIRRRARHVTSENARVLAFADALRSGDVTTAGEIMLAGHASLRDDFEVSTPVMDEAVERTAAHPGVYGARMTGGGFGGCIVAICEPGSLDRGWKVTPSDGARQLD